MECFELTISSGGKLILALGPSSRAASKYHAQWVLYFWSKDVNCHSGDKKSCQHFTPLPRVGIWKRNWSWPLHNLKTGGSSKDHSYTDSVSDLRAWKKLDSVTNFRSENTLDVACPVCIESMIYWAQNGKNYKTCTMSLPLA